MGAASDTNGDYMILNLSPNEYTVTISMIGYKTVTYENVKISIDKTTRLDVPMLIEAIEGEAIIVKNHRMIQKDLTNTESRISSDELEVMPVIDVQDVIKLQGGVTQDANGGIHIRGGRSSEVVYI